MLISFFAFISTVKGGDSFYIDEVKVENTLDDESLDCKYYDDSKEIIIDKIDDEFEEDVSEDYENKDNLSTDYEKISIDYNDRSFEEKVELTKIYYGDLINLYATKYGIDPNLMLGIAIQERGIHSGNIDPTGAIGLMQIQYNVWVNQTISAYNFDTG